MQALIAPLKELAEYDEIRKVTRQGKGTVAPVSYTHLMRNAGGKNYVQKISSNQRDLFRSKSNLL